MKIGNSSSRTILLVLCIAHLAMTKPKPKPEPKDEDDLIGKIVTQHSRDGKLSEQNQNYLEKILNGSGGNCRAVSFTQTVRHKDCPDQVHEIENKMCFGQCLSRTDPMVDGERKESAVTTCLPTKKFKKMIGFDKCSDGKTHVTEIEDIRSCECKTSITGK